MIVTTEDIAFIENMQLNYLKVEHDQVATFLHLYKPTEEESRKAKMAVWEAYRKCNDLAGIDAYLRLLFVQQKSGNFGALGHLKKMIVNSDKDLQDSLRMIDRLNEMKECVTDEDVKRIDHILKLF